ncbi:MAG: nucleotide modification associated domain-containing protein [Clostridium sp.]|nr:nucleotide modification associated domain-containing protein [Clostridium sp.]
MSDIAKLEQKYDIHKSYCDKLNGIYRAKNTDYDDSFAKGIDNMGYTSAIVRMDDKMNCVRSLLLNNADKPQVNESVMDTLLDLANYSLMLLTEYEVRNLI